MAETETGAIEQGDAYPLAEFERLTGFGRHAVRSAKRNGLKVRRAGNRTFVLGDDFIQFLANDDRMVDGQNSTSY